MKRSIKTTIQVLLILISVSIVATFSFAGCTEKAPVAEEPAAGGTVAEEPAAEEIVEETPAEEAGEAGVLEIYHWWTSGSEKAAMDALIGVYLESYPDVVVLESPVAGGGGISMREVIQTLMLADEAPDSFQSYPFGLVSYWEAGMLEPIDDVWTSEVRDAVPDVVEDMCKMPDGHYYAVPAGVQQAGIIFYNKQIFDRFGLEEPQTWDEFWLICDTLKSEGIDAVALGDKNAWPLTYIFRTLTASEGVGYYEDFINGKITSADNPNLLSSLTNLNKILDYVNSDHGALTWDEAMGLVAKGEAAMSVMGDCGAGEFIVAEKVYGQDFGAFRAPGAADMFGISLDVFALPKGSKHPTNALNWIKALASAEAQGAFAGPKGFIPARTDADMSVGFSDYQRDSSAVHFAGAKYYRPGMWSGTPEAFMGKLTDIISNSIGINRDVEEAAGEIANLQSEIEWPKEWDLAQ